MKPVVLAGLALLLPPLVWAEQGAPGPLTVRSSSGQFVVHPLPAATPSIAAGTNAIYLDPALLAVSSERVKQALAHELGNYLPWQGKIHLHLRHARSPHEQVTIVITEGIGSRWMYRVDLPDVLDRDRYLGALVQALLLEIANRGPVTRPVEVPVWLAQGLSRHLLESSEIQLVLLPPGANVGGLKFQAQIADQHWSNRLARAQQELRSRPALTFEQLSWPPVDQLTGAAGERYRCSAQVFVQQLLRLRNGQASVRTMLEILPQYYNWQLAFLEAFHAHFQTPLDVEKWWALQVVQFTGRDLTQMWTREESWRRLDAALVSTVSVRTGSADLPLHSDVPLQSILREWDHAQQLEVLSATLRVLDSLRLRSASEVLPIIDGYRQCLANYVQKRNASGPVVLTRRTGNPLSDPLSEETLRQLDALDLQRAALRPAPPAARPTEEVKAPGMNP